MRPLNLASRPFRNERLPSLLGFLLVVTALGVTVLHAMAGARVGPSRLGKAENEARDLEAGLERLRSERATLADLRPSPEDRALWGSIRDLVDQRLFRWTLLLSRLNDVLPEDVRLTSIEPTLRNGQIDLRLSATATTRGSPSLLALVGILEKQPEFQDVTPASLSDTPDGDVLIVQMRYLPPPDTPPKATPSPEAEP